MCNLCLVSAFRGLGPLKAHESRRDQLLGWTQTKLFKIFCVTPFQLSQFIENHASSYVLE